VGEPVRFTLRHSREDYLHRVGRALDHIRDGESYEVCLTNRLHTGMRPDAESLYRTLRTMNPAPYAAFLAFPGLCVLSSSPECFLKLDQLGNVTAKPIKGTIRRSDDPIKDHALAAQLRTSEKDRAENLMIVDLLRNDLGRVCELGSVHVPELMEIESFATVHQMVTTISGRLAPEHDFVDCLLAAFPGGSMTGAPKTRTLGIIEELEEAQRGIYSGAIGFLSANGAAEMSIVIRTIVMDKDGCSIGAGGAIVAASKPAAEYDEIMLKARALIEAIAECATGDPQAYEVATETSAAPEPAIVF
jgi:para-aminobenzoate synthetase